MKKLVYLISLFPFATLLQGNSVGRRIQNYMQHFYQIPNIWKVQKSAENIISNLIMQLNPEVPDLKVIIEYM